MQQSNKRWIPFLTIFLFPFAGLFFQGTDTIIGILGHCPEFMCYEEPTYTQTPILHVEKLGSFPIDESVSALTLITPITEAPHTSSYTTSMQKVELTMRIDTSLSPYRGQFGFKLECANGGWFMLLSNSDNDQLTLEYANHSSDVNPPQLINSLTPHTPIPITLSLAKNTLAIGSSTYPLNITCNPNTFHVLTYLACNVSHPLANSFVAVQGAIENLTITY